MEAASLYGRLGGADGFETVADGFYDRMREDERLALSLEDDVLDR